MPTPREEGEEAAHGADRRGAARGRERRSLTGDPLLEMPRVGGEMLFADAARVADAFVF